MKNFSKILLALTLSLVWLSVAKAQGDLSQPAVGDWTIYNADELPDAADPAWEASNGSGTTWAIESDPVRVGNNVLTLDGADASGMYKTSDFDPVPGAVTVVMRVKAKDPAAERLTDIDMHINGLRDQLNIRSTGELSLQRSGASVDLSGELNVSQWNIFRMTIDASSGTEGIVNIYLNESPYPVLTATTTTTTGSNYFRFGDGNGSPSYSAYVDYITWDVTGAYSPSQTRLPNDLTKPPVGDWLIYHANELPDAADPAWEASNGSGTTWAIESDPVRAGNNVLALDGADASGMFKTSDFDPVPEAVTVVMRVKAKDLAADRLTDIDMHINGIRDQLNIRSNGELTLQRSGASVDLSGLLNVSDWNIFRMTIDASSGTEGTVKVYLNENPLPVLTATSTTTTGSNYFRFGDGNGSPSYSAYVDYITWDVTGAYSPSQTRLPNEVVKPPVGEWIVYHANELPDAADPAWEASNGSGTTWAIESDPVKAGNNLLALDGADASGMYKTSDFDPVPTAVTVVMRVKSKDPAAERLTDIDMHINGIRDQLNIRSNGELTLQRSGASVDLSGVLNVSQWNVFRMTIDASSGTEGIVNIYLNENPYPVLTATSTTTTGSNYFRFGDGNGSPSYSAYVDYILWDETGAYSPAQTRLPAELTGDDEGPSPVISSPSALAAFSQHLGTPSEENSFAVSGTDLQADITVTPPAGYEISLIPGSGFATDPLVLPQTDGVVAETTVYIRLNATEVGSYEGSVSLVSGDANRAMSVSGMTVVPEITVSAALEHFVESVSGSSPVQSYSVSGIYLVDDVTVTAPENYELSLDENTWTNSVVISPDVDGNISGASIFVRLNATALGESNGDIVHSSMDAENANLAVTGETIPDPGITVNGEFTPFSQGLGTPSESQTYTLAGANLADNIMVSLPSGFEVSFNGEVWLPSLTVSPLNGNVSEITLYVRLNASAEGATEGDIVHSSTGVDAVSLAVSGTTGPGLVTGLDDIDMSFNLWPNPSSDRIIFERNDASSKAQLTIHNLSGKIVASNTFNSNSSKLEIDISSLQKGVYLLEYIDDNIKTVQRFIKE